MSPKASSDFGLYKEKQKENNIKSIKFILILISIVFFLFVTLYTLVYLIRGTKAQPLAKAEKLVFSESRKREVQNPPPPKPFALTYRGQPPAEFTSTTEKITTLSYPQIRQRHRYIPHNIQDVIGYANQYNLPDSKKESSRKTYKQSSTENVQNRKINFFAENDPFYLFKPQDPSDVNLLATSRFRFAPPSWRSNTPKSYPKFYGNTKRQEILTPPKPVSLTLNFYPNKKRQKYGDLRPFINHRMEERPSEKIRFPDDKKMIFHLNLYPEEEAN